VSRAPGFSILELVVTLVIAGILAAIAIPRFTDSESKATYFHGQVKAAVRYAQRQAVAQRRCVFVEVSATQVKLFYGDASCAITGTPLTFLTTIASGKAPGDPYVLDAPSGVTITSNVTPFSFNGLGQPSAPVSLSVGGTGITVVAETGYVQ
jgi:MSHA pilin protein MshC